MKKVDPYDFMAFILTYLRHHLKKETPDKVLSDFHYELCQTVQHERVAIAAPRAFAKTTFMGFFYPLYLLLEVPESRVVIVSATHHLSEFLCLKIRDELQYNEKITAKYGPMISKSKKNKWANGEFTLPNGNACAARGYGQQVRGFRPTHIIGDDLETDEMVVSTHQRNKFDHWFNSSLTNTLVPGMQFIWVGTLLDPQSALSKVIHEGRSGWKTFFYQAIMDEKSLWPEMWPLDELKKRENEIGPTAFAQEFMNDPIPDGARVFKKEYFKYYDSLPKGLVKFMAVDPAINLKVKHDYTAMVVVGVDDVGNWFVVDYVRKKLNPKESVDVMFEMCLKHNIQIIGIEEVAFQAMLIYEFKEQRKDRNIFTKVVPLKSGGRRKRLRIESLQPRYETGKIYHKIGMEDLETELVRFPSPGCHDDLIDALSYVQQISRTACARSLEKGEETFGDVLERRRRQLNDDYDVVDDYYS